MLLTMVRVAGPLMGLGPQSPVRPKKTMSTKDKA